MTVRLLTYNIHGGTGIDGRHDYRRIGRFLEQQAVDIALIQEMDTRPRHRNTMEDIAELCGDHFPFFMPAPSVVQPHGWYGNALLSRYPARRHEVIDITVIGREPRNIQEAFFETPEGLLHVLNTHKGLRTHERRKQMGLLGRLLQRKSDVPLIVGGDINEWHNYSGALKKLNQTLTAIPVGATFPTRFPVFHLDRLWCRPHGIIESVKIVKTPETRLYSDHYPVLAELELPG